MRTACEQSFKTKKARKAPQKNKSVPWWTHELTAARKITNYLRRKYQRTRDNAEQREINKEAYFAQKAKYAATIKREKTKSWKEYCNLTTEANPWNAVYRLASGKKRTNTQVTTLRKPDGSLTSDTKETLRLMLEYFAPEDNDLDNNHHKHIRELTDKHPNTPDDREFTREDIGRVIEEMNNKKAPREDGIRAEIYKLTFKIFPKSITAMYNVCLKNGIFPDRWKKAKIIRIMKPGTQTFEEVTKYRPISLLNVGGKILERALINRKKPLHVFNGVPQQEPVWIHSANEQTNAIMALKDFVQEGF